MIAPHEPSGTSSLSSWLRRLLRYVLSLEIRPGIGYMVRRTPQGTVLEISPRSGDGAAREYQLKSVQGDYITCRTWDGTRAGASDVFIAKTYLLRESTTAIGAYTCTFDNGVDALNRKRKKMASAEDYEWQVVVPVWTANEIIYAIPAATTVDDKNGNKCTLLLQDSRAWSEAYGVVET